MNFECALIIGVGLVVILFSIIDDFDTAVLFMMLVWFVFGCLSTSVDCL